MAFATGCVVAAGALISSTAGRQVMTSAASNTAQHILAMVIGSKNEKTNLFLSTRIQAKLECILHLFKSMEKSHVTKKEHKEDQQIDSYEHTMWNRVFREMTTISALVAKMQQQQEEDKKSWLRYVWPRSQEKHQQQIIVHLETIEEIIRFVSMVAPYVKSRN